MNPNEQSDISQVPSDMQQSNQPVTPEQMQKLHDMLDEVNKAFERFKAIRFAAENKTKIIKNDIREQIFELMMQDGINLEDRGSVSSFIEGVREKSPELADQFENAMNMILDDESDTQPSDGSVPLDAPVDVQSNPDPLSNNEINNENISQDPRGLSQTSIG